MLWNVIHLDTMNTVKTKWSAHIFSAFSVTGGVKAFYNELQKKIVDFLSNEKKIWENLT